MEESGKLGDIVIENKENLRKKKIIETKLGVDCKFLVGKEPNQKIFSGHKIILAIASPTFESYFCGNLPPEDVIKVPDVDPHIFQMMMDYIYLDEIKILDIDDSIDLLYVAKKYFITPLVKLCTDYLLRNLNPSNVCKIFEYVCLFDEADLKNFCLQFISARTKTILLDEKFLEVKPTTLFDIFSLSRLNIDSELDLWNALNNYVINNDYIAPLEQNELKKSNLEKSAKINFEDNKILANGVVKENNKDVVSNEENLEKSEQDGNIVKNAIKPANVEKNYKNFVILKQAAENIRFLTLTPQEFSSMCILPEIMNDSEALALLMKICNPNCSRSFPKGFSIFTTKRNAPLALQTNIQVQNTFTQTNTLYNDGWNNALGQNSRSFATNCTYCGRQICESSKRYDSVELYKKHLLISLVKAKCINIRDKPKYQMCFNVDETIYLTGVVLPTQMSELKSDYIECLRICVLGDQDQILGHTNFTKKLPYSSFFSVLFPVRVPIDTKMIYKIEISYYTNGRYPMYSSFNEAQYNNVNFLFFIELEDNPLRAGLIRKILFET
ncbi:uncharacterized protein LOC129618834 isoform X2 [Condylostylus longicornis]|uniref:uncharacterized protein LOC129618834 isoform X2 n=1 Tax=Condylostylus longicornis TaxID=2530218 RepID=UPI00244E0B59|nr:uncharacterized protein LOC129618834 isoform X2 [Condylostylus longicornis]